MVLIIAKLVAKDGKAEEFIEVTKPLIAGSQAEEGNIEYILYRSQDDPNTFHFIEKWRDMDAIKAHQSASHYVEAGPKLGPLLAGKEVTQHDPV